MGAVDLRAIERDIFDADAPGTAAQVRQHIVTEAPKYGVDPALALALVQTESNFFPQAVSPTGVTGLFQVQTDTGAPYGQTADNRMDYTVSTHAGLSELAKQLKASGGNVPQALARYGDPGDPQYASKVLANYRLQQASLPLMAAADGKAEPDLRQIEAQIFGTGAPQSSAPQPSAPQPGPQLAPAMPLRTQDVGVYGAGSTPGPGGGGGLGPSDVVPPELRTPGATQVVLPIEKRSAPGPESGGPPAPAQAAASGFWQQPIRLLPGDLDARVRSALGIQGTPPSVGAVGREGLATGLETAAGAAGALAGGATGPLAPVASPVLAGLATYGAHQFNKWAGLTPGEPTAVPQDLQDWLALTLPMAAAPVEAGLRRVAGWTAGGKALREASLAEQAIARLKALPAKYQPPIPSAELYADFAKSAGTKAIDLAPVQTTLAEQTFQDNLKYAPRLQKVVNDLQSQGATVEAGTLHDLMKQVTKAGREGDSTTRYLSGRVADSINEAMATSIPGDKPMLDLAKSTWRQEQGVALLDKMYGAGGGIVRIDPSVPGGKSLILNVGELLNRTARTTELSQWFDPATYTKLQQEIGTFAGTPSPSGVLREAPRLPPVKLNWTKDVVGPLLGAAGTAATGRLLPLTAAVPLGVDVANQVISHLMLSPQWGGPFRAWMQSGGGPMRPELAAAFAALAAQVARYHVGQGGQEGGAPPAGSTQGRYQPGEEPARSETPVPGSTRGRYSPAY